MIKSSYKLLRKIFGSLYFLVFINGFLLASLFYFRTEAIYEREVFSALKKSIDKTIGPEDNKDSIVIKIMRTCNELMGNRFPVFEGSKDFVGVKVDYFHPATIDLMTGRGGCGSFSMVLARVLQDYHYPVRIVQMYSEGRYAAHNIIEVNVNTKWVVLDPLFNTYFVKSNQKELASYDDVKNNWAYYRKQLPADYNPAYVYTEARYTNWEKVPIIFPLAKKMLNLVLGKAKADTISLRVHFLKMYDFYYYLTFILFVPLFVLMIRKMIKRKFFAAAASNPLEKTTREFVQKSQGGSI
ncbi:MAG: hypothetical protein JST58_20825 [Bacteroidetes bacterium]|nr:hypothetical protein [Bacteroidota bacterium]